MAESNALVLSVIEIQILVIIGFAAIWGLFLACRSQIQIERLTERIKKLEEKSDITHLNF